MDLVPVFIAMLDRPSEAMRAATQRPRSWWLPALLLVAGALVSLAAAAPLGVQQADQRTAQMMARVAARMSAEQAQQVRQNSAPMTVQRYLLTGIGAIVVTGALALVARGAMAHFASMAAGGNSVWGPTFAATTWSMLPFFLRDLLQATFVLTQKRLIEHQGLSFLVASGNWLQDSGNVLYAALSQVDLFALWHIVLLGVGISVATRLGRRSGLLLAIVIWLVMLGVSLFPVVLGRALGGGALG